MTRIRQFGIQNQNIFLERGPPHKNFWAALDLASRLQVLALPLLLRLISWYDRGSLPPSKNPAPLSSGPTPQTCVIKELSKVSE